MSDYARIADAIRFIASQVARQPTLRAGSYPEI